MLIVFALALGPVAVGWALDAGLGTAAVAGWAAAIALATSTLAWRGLSRPDAGNRPFTADPGEL